MPSNLTEFRVGDLYENDEIQASLNVGNAGGVRIGLDGTRVKRMVVLTSVPDARQLSENPYHDRTEGNVLVYTGAGREGDQSLAGINKRIPQQVRDRFPIYGFQLIGSRRDRTIGRKRWQFIGLLEFIRHYPELQLDARRAIRQVWIFEFLIHGRPVEIRVANDDGVSRSLLIESAAQANLTADDRQVDPLTQDSDAQKDRETAVEVEAERVRLLALSPQDFEYFIRDVLVATGFERVHVTKFSQDGGIDVNAHAGNQMWPIREMLIQIQAKRWLHTVGRREVAELRGSLQPFSRGAIITTSHFSRAAISEATEPGKNPIVLVDGYTFARTVRSLSLPHR